MLTKLEAVNRLLRATGEDPVSSLVDGLPEAEAAEEAVDWVTRLVLSKGWHWNTEYNVSLSPDNDGYINVPSTALRIDSYGKDAYRDVVVRAHPNDAISTKVLYDRYERSYSFDKAIRTEVVYLYDFEDLVAELQIFITAVAATLFQSDEIGSVTLDKFVSREESNAWAALLDAECEAADSNFIRDNPHGRRVAWRNSRNRFY